MFEMYKSARRLSSFRPDHETFEASQKGIYVALATRDNQHTSMAEPGKWRYAGTRPILVALPSFHGGGHLCFISPRLGRDSLEWSQAQVVLPRKLLSSSITKTIKAVAADRARLHVAVDSCLQMHGQCPPSLAVFLVYGIPYQKAARFCSNTESM